MKLIYAIIRYDNEDDVTTSLTKHKFSVTRHFYYRWIPEKR